MSSIKSTIELYDSFSSPLMNIVNTVNSSVSVMEQMQAAMNRPIDTSSMNMAQSQINDVTEAARQLEAAMQDVSSPSVSVLQPQIDSIKGITVPVTAVVEQQPIIDSPDGVSVPVTPYVMEQVNVDTPENVSVAVTPYVTENVNIDTPEDMYVSVILDNPPSNEQCIEGLQERLNGVLDLQNAINAVSSNLYLLPDGNADEIKNINKELERMQQAIEYVRSNPFMLDTSVSELQIQSISDSLDELTERQRVLNVSMGNVPAAMAAPTPSPVEIPVKWESFDGLEVFTNTGIERFQQEVASTNAMLGNLSETQIKISQQASEISILPQQAVTDIQNVGGRIQSLQQMIEQVENNPLNMGTDSANAALERLRGQLSQTLALQDNLDQAMQGMDISEINAAYQQLSQNISDSERLVRDFFSNIPPVNVPVHWKSDSVETFTNTGIERFQQEVQNANSMLNTLNSTQQQIAAAAVQTNLFPANAVADMNTMQNRLQAIQQRIQTIENNPLNIGSDTANAELEQLRGQLDQAVQEQEMLNRAVENMDIEAANEAYLRLSQTVGNTERYIRDNVDEQGNFNREIERGTNEADQLMQTIKGAVAAYASIQTVGKIIDLSDTMTQTTARLDLIVDDGGSVEELQNKIYASAQNARGSYQATADAVSKLGLMAGDAFSGSDEIVAFMEQVNKQFTIAGTEASGIDAAMLQLTQAMGSGVLRGEEFNSILEQAPNIIQAIADYMDVPKGQLKDMAAEGLITSDIVKNAMFAAADETNAKFEQMPMTFSQILTSFQNTALVAFQPVLQRMNEIANSETFQDFIEVAINALAVLAEIVTHVFNLMINAAEFISNNWSVIAPIVMGIVAALTAYMIIAGIINTINGIMATIEGVKAAAQMMATGATFAETAAQYGLNAALAACPLTWIIVLIIALIAIIFAVCSAIAKFTGIANSGFGVICGGVNVVIQFFKNLGLGVANIALGIWEALGALCNNFMTAFHNAICSVQSWWYELLSTCLTVIEKICADLN